MLKTTLNSAILAASFSLAAALPAFAQQGAGLININGQFVLAAKAGQTARAAALLSEGAAVNSRDRLGDSPRGYLRGARDAGESTRRGGGPLAA